MKVETCLAAPAILADPQEAASQRNGITPRDRVIATQIYKARK